MNLVAKQKENYLVCRVLHILRTRIFFIFVMYLINGNNFDLGFLSTILNFFAVKLFWHFDIKH